MSETGDTGFTLLEMMVTLAVMALIAGIGYPALLRTTNHMAFVRATREADASLRTARAMAIKAGAPVSLQLAGDGRWQAGDRLIGTPLPQQVTATLTPIALIFYADGTARPGQLSLGDGHESWSVRVAASGLIS